jgi:hypothetical protein
MEVDSMIRHFGYSKAWLPQEPGGRDADWLRWPHAGSPIGCWPVRQQQGAFLGLFLVFSTPRHRLQPMFRRVSRVRAAGTLGRSA